MCFLLDNKRETAYNAAIYFFNSMKGNIDGKNKNVGRQ